MDSKIKFLRSNNGGEFTSKEFMDYYRKHGIKRQFFVARTPQQNGVVERKNMTVQKMDSKLTDIFWTHAMHTVVHIQNRLILRNNTDRTLYELWKGIPLNVKHSRVFGSKCYIKEKMEEWKSLTLVWTKEYLLVTQVQGKVLSGYSSTRKSTFWLLKYKESI
jgi:transposase InsO family protein